MRTLPMRAAESPDHATVSPSDPYRSWKQAGLLLLALAWIALGLATVAGGDLGPDRHRSVRTPDEDGLDRTCSRPWPRWTWTESPPDAAGRGLVGRSRRQSSGSNSSATASS